MTLDNIYQKKIVYLMTNVDFTGWMPSDGGGTSVNWVSFVLQLELSNL